MKKNFIKKIAKIFSVFAGCLLLASFSPSLDGRAVVVDEGVFPEGLFAKTVGYLPGDTISVTNVAGDTTVDLLVIGALDPSEGVAIMLSPEAAAEIGIEKDSNNIVKITKRSGQDERVFGTAVIAKSDELPKEDLVQEEVAEETDEYDVEYNPADFHEEYVEEEEVEEETDEYEYDVEYNPADFHEEYVEDEEIEEEFIEAEELEDIAEEEVAETLEDELIEEEIAAYEEEIESEEVSDEKIEDLPEEFDEEIIQEVDESIEEETEEIVIEEVAEDLVAEEEIPLEEEFVEADSLDELESLDEELEVVETDDEVELIEEATEEEYEAIVLVPVESNPPAVESTEEEIVEETIEPIVAPVVEKSVTVVPEPIILEPSKETETSTSYQKYLVPSLQDLESGKYYIQIASLRDDKNIEEIISKYANNYPITIVPNRAGTVKQVMVGPLSMDEYGVVLQRFKSYGYKDAFLRKIK